MCLNYEELILNLKNILKNDDIKLNELMRNHTTFKIGGPCDIMIFPNNELEFVNSIREIIKFNIPYFILGLGSNLIVKDGGIRGVVINLTKFNNISVKDNIINAKSGAKLCDISNKAYENSLTGFEFACGIPGTIGGGVNMNAGAYGGELSFVINRVKVIDSNGEVFYISKDEMDFSYRSTKIMKNNYVMIECDIELKKGNKEEIKKVIDDLTNRRESKQPLEFPSAGSIFKRPEGYYAGKLIEDSGLRGYVHKNVMISDKHCGFIVSIEPNKVKASEVLELIQIIRDKVYKKFNVNLEMEVKVVGED